MPTPHRAFVFLSATILVIYVLLTGLPPASGQTEASDQHPPSPERFALVELYTSQGCSSCPPADELLLNIDEVAKQRSLPIYVLSYHVDYWNSLGWKDPYSKPEFSQRQRTAARRSGEGRVYTPQMVVNGTESFVGSNSRLATDAIKLALAKEAETTITLKTKREGNRLRVDYQVATPQEGDQIVIALTSQAQSNAVPRGENAGRTLTHRHVVMAYGAAELDASGNGAVEMATNDAVRVIAFVENDRTRKVRGLAVSMPE